MNNEQQAFIGMVKKSQILHVYASNVAQWIINICQIQNQWKLEKQRARIYYVTHYVIWTCWSKISFGLEIKHQNRFKMHIESATLVFECLYQSTNISNSIRMHLCPHLYNLWRMEKLYWFHLFDITTSASHGHQKHHKLEQLERLRSEDTPRRPMITHTIDKFVLNPKSILLTSSYRIPSQNKVKSEN